MKNHRKVFILAESLLAVFLVLLVARMFWEKNGESRYKVSVVVQNSDSSQWASFQYGLKMAAQDQNVELSIASTGGALTLEEEKELIEAEAANGADAVIVQPVPGEGAEEMLKMLEKKIPIMLAGCGARPEEGSLLPVTGPDNYGMGKALAEELLKDYGGSMEGKTFGILAEQGGSQAAASRERGVREALERKGAAARWSVSGFFSEDGEHSLKQQPEVDVVIALDDSSLVAAGECAASKDLHGALVYGIGHSTEAAYYLDTDMVQCLVVPDGFQMGYQCLTELARGLGLFFRSFKGQRVSYTVLRREALFTEENQELLFTMSQ